MVLIITIITTLIIKFILRDNINMYRPQIQMQITDKQHITTFQHLKQIIYHHLQKGVVIGSLLPTFGREDEEEVSIKGEAGGLHGEAHPAAEVWHHG